MKISMKLVYQYMAILFTFSSASNHLHPLQVENCDSNSRLVVDEDDNGKFRLETVEALKWFCINYGEERFCFQFEIIINVLDISFRFILISILLPLYIYIIFEN